MFNLVTFLMWFCWLSYFTIPWLVALGLFPGHLHDRFADFYLYWAVGLTVVSCLFELLKLGNERVKAKETK